MVDKFRNTFGDMPRSLRFPGDMPEEEQSKLFASVIDYAQQNLPHSLFRYRSCTDYSINGFLSDTVYSVVAANSMTLMLR